MDFIDTNILIEQFKKHTKDEIDKDVFGKSISSISALEFLNVMGKSYKPLSYLVLDNRHSYSSITVQPETYVHIVEKYHPAALSLTDRIVIDFNNEFPSVIIYSNQSICNYVNKNHQYLTVYPGLEKFNKKQLKTFRKKLNYLCLNKICLYPLSQNILNRMHRIYEDIKQTNYNMKVNYRNSFMDLLILATAIENDGVLITKDNELNNVYHRNLTDALKDSCKYLNVTAGLNGTTKIYELKNDNFKLNNKCSEKYINNSWRIIEKNRTNIKLFGE